MDNDAVQLDYDEEDLIETDSTGPSFSGHTSKGATDDYGSKDNLTIHSHTDIPIDELLPLYEEMHARGGNFNLRTVLVKGVDEMTAFDVEKIFAEFKPYRVEILKDISALVYFTSRQAAAQMMREMSKRLRRVRSAKKAEEEGEILESSEEDEEEGVLKEENGDDVEIVAKGPNHKTKQRSDQCVKIDVDTVQIPAGRWRVVTEHVPDSRLLIIRFATREEIKNSRENRIDYGKDRKRKAVEFDEEGYNYQWTQENLVRPGLNVFDDKGKELDWDYEHDTRFFAGPEGPVESKEDPEIRQWGADDVAPPRKIRGRGAARAHLLLFDKDADTMRADTELKTHRKAKPDNNSESNQDGSESPSGQKEAGDPTNTRWIRGDKITIEFND